MTQPILIEAHSFPCIIYVSLWQHHPLCLEGCEHYQKRSFRNKYQIMTAQGPVTLTLPLTKGKHQQMPIGQVAIAYDEPWPKKHLHTLQAAYARAPWYEHYLPDLIDLYANPGPTLLAFNLATMALVRKWTGIAHDYTLTDNYAPTRPDTIDLRNQLYLRKKMPWPDTCRYDHVFADRVPFAPNLSILDAIFCLGPDVDWLLECIYWGSPGPLFSNIFGTKE